VSPSASIVVKKSVAGRLLLTSTDTGWVTIWVSAVVAISNSTSSLQL